jgi:gliding-associated putative ABC transporter substrate-binding component GldG
MNSKIQISVLLIITIIIVVNLLANEYYVRLDLTEDRQYTLSQATEQILADLDEPVTIKAYFSNNLPPNVRKTRDDFRDLLIEYANISDGQVLFQFVDPGEKESIEQEAVQNGIRPVLIDIREKDQVKQQKAFLGATVELAEQKEVIPFIQPGAAMEYSLSTAIKKISVTTKPKLGFVTGHGEPSLSEMIEVNNQLSILYEPTEIALTDSTVISDEIKTLAVIRPTDSIPQSDLDKLDSFMSRGGRLLVAINRVQGDFRSFYGTAINTGLETWLNGKGIEVQDNFIVDTQCGSISMPQQMGAFTVQAHVSLPYVPVVGTFADHPITSGLESVMFEFASEVSYKGTDSIQFKPVAFSSEMSAALPAPQFFDINKDWREGDFQRKHIPVVATLEGKLSGQTFSRMVVIGDGDFPVNGPPQQARRLQGDNVNLLVNAIDWLSDDTGLIELRTKGAASRPIRELDDQTKAILKYLNFLLPVALAIIYGVLRAQRNRMISARRMGENFEI